MEVNPEAINKAAALVEALSYIQRFHNKVIVVKVGGSIMDDEEALSAISHRHRVHELRGHAAGAGARRGEGDQQARWRRRG